MFPTLTPGPPCAPSVSRKFNALSKQLYINHPALCYSTRFLTNRMCKLYIHVTIERKIEFFPTAKEKMSR